MEIKKNSSKALPEDILWFHQKLGDRTPVSLVFSAPSTSDYEVARDLKICMLKILLFQTIADSNTSSSQRIQSKIYKVDFVLIMVQLVQKWLPFEMKDGMFDHSNFTYLNILML